MRNILGVVLSLLTGLSAACAQPAPPASQAGPAPEMRAGAIESAKRVAPRSMGEVHLSFSPVVEMTAPAVVNVFTSRTVARRTTSDPFFDRFFSAGPQKQNSLGSGVIVSTDGVIVTNNHVIDGMDEIKVVFADRREYAANVLLKDKQSDLAVLKIDAGEPLPFLEFANSDAAEVGDVVLAIGNPFGVGQTVTSGIVSALSRTTTSISDYQFFIQTDAAINPGNSGGALVDINGKLLGVNTAIYSTSGGSNGIGFAIPARLVQQVIRSALNGGQLMRPWIGAATDTVTADLARAMKLARPSGAIVNDIWPSGPAAAAGLKDGDVIISIDGQPVHDAATLHYRVGIRSENETSTVVYLRNGAERTAQVRLRLPPDEPRRDPRRLAGAHPLDGVSVDNLSPRFNEQIGFNPFKAGVVVTEIERGAFAVRRGLRPGYRIVSVNGRAIANAAQLDAELTRPATSWLLEIDTGKDVVPWRVGR